MADVQDRRIEETVRQLSAERDEARAQAAELTGQLELARREITALNARLDELSAVETDPSQDDRTSRLLEIAKSQANEITSRAQAAADHAWAAAEQSSITLRDRYQHLLADLDRQHAEIHAAHESIMRSAQSQAHAMTAEAEERRRAIDQEAEQDRIRIDREFSESMNAKREALRKEIEAARASAAKEAERRIREATEEGERRLTAARQQIDQLTRVRDQLATRLRETRELLEQTADVVKASELEQELSDENLLVR
jgi:chromosome segregation ATPase